MRQLIAFIGFFLIAAAAEADPARDPIELERTWANALVYLPNDAGQVRRAGIGDVGAYLKAHPKAQIIVYAHGCAGFSRIDRKAGRFHAGLGRVFVAPDSFARETKPVSCQPLVQKGGLHRAVLGWRQAEIDHALRRLRAMSGASPIALVGHSEGGITVATLRSLPVAARVIEGWTCHAGWPEYRGLNAPTREPVLSLVGENDRWFQDPDVKGNCAAFMDRNDKSIVFRRPDPLHNNHWLTSKQRARDIVAKFLAQHM